MTSDGGHADPVFEQRLRDLDQALIQAPEDLRPLLLDIRTSAVRLQAELAALRQPTASWHNGIQAICFQCGRQHLEVVYSSKRDGFQLCEQCFRAWEQGGHARTATMANHSGDMGIGRS